MICTQAILTLDRWSAPANGKRRGLLEQGSLRHALFGPLSYRFAAGELCLTLSQWRGLGLQHCQVVHAHSSCTATLPCQFTDAVTLTVGCMIRLSGCHAGASGETVLVHGLATHSPPAPQFSSNLLANLLVSLSHASKAMWLLTTLSTSLSLQAGPPRAQISNAC